MADTFIIRQGLKEWRIQGEGLCFGKRVKPGAPMYSTEFVDDPNLIKALDAEGKSIFVVMLSHAKDVISQKLPP